VARFDLELHFYQFHFQIRNSIERDLKLIWIIISKAFYDMNSDFESSRELIIIIGGNMLNTISKQWKNKNYHFTYVLHTCQ